jgi:hypothetical protein
MNEAHSKTVHSMEQAKEHRTVRICRRTVANVTDAKSPDRTTLLEIRIGLVPLLWPELLMLFDGPDHAEGRFLGELWGGGADGRVGRRWSIDRSKGERLTWLQIKKLEWVWVFGTPADVIPGDVRQNRPFFRRKYIICVWDRLAKSFCDHMVWYIQLSWSRVLWENLKICYSK